MKKVILGILIGAILMMTFNVFAETRTIQAFYDDIRLRIDGKFIEMDVEPCIINGRTMVPARYIAEYYGAKVYFNETDNCVDIFSPTPTPTPIPIFEPKTTPAPTPIQEEASNPVTLPTTEIKEEEPTPEPTTIPSPTPTATPSPTPTVVLQRVTTLISGSTECFLCHSNGWIGERRTVYEGGQEYLVADVTCRNPKCKMYNQVIGQMKWLVEYK